MSRCSERSDSDVSPAVPLEPSRRTRAIAQIERPIKVLHVFSRMDAGGAEMRTVDILRHLNRDRYHIDFCTHSSRKGCLDNEIKSLGSTIYPISLGPNFPRRFVQLLRREAYDVVHSHTHHASGFFLRLARIARTPIRIAHFRSTGDGRPSTIRRRLQRAWLRRWIDRHATHILAVSRSAMEAAWRPDWAADPRCSVVYNGLEILTRPIEGEPVEVRREFRIDAEALFVIHVGNFSRDKNHRRVISTFAEIARLKKNCHLLLIGQGNNKLQLEVRQQVESLRLDDRVTFGGRRADVPRLLKAAELMLFPSWREGLPGAVLEACATGLPVLASRLPVIREIEPHLPSLQSLPLEATVHTWAVTALKHHARFTGRGRREMARQSFATSPFQIEQTTHLLCRMWSSGRSQATSSLLPEAA